MKLKLTETSLRDGHQSLIATRLKTEEILPILEKMDKVGFRSLEVWGGATFDSCIRFLNEDPWERLREIRKKVKNTKLQMLLRGQNLLGYRCYSDDIVELFIEKAIKNGIDIIRVFDALNDFRNLESSIKMIKKYKGEAQVCICYTTSPIHTVEYYIEKAKELEQMGADSICIKDMAGILLPEVGYKLIKELKSQVSVPLQLHTHATSGISEMLYLRAIDAGIDVIDTAISPLSGGTSQPATESICYSLKGTDRDPLLDMDLLTSIADYFKPIKEKYRQNGIFNSKVMDTEPMTLRYQVPGGMMSNLLSQLKQQNSEDSFEDVLKEIPNVRKDLGYPPLVTPLSQMVGTQAVFNVLTKERYKVVPKEIRDYLKGLYGQSPMKIEDEFIKKIIGDDEIVTCRPADLIKDEYDNIKNLTKDFAKSDEDILIYALFPEVGKNYLENKYKKVDKKIINIEICS